jgi:MoaA/NifB/PqqE/SkfB family radical SAM enzyme
MVKELIKKASKFSLIKMYFPYFWKVPLKFSIYASNKFKYQNPKWFNNQIWVNTLSPPYPSEAFNRFMEVLIENKRYPQSTDFAVTSKCPYNCPFCSYGRRIKKDLTTKQIIDIINQLKDLRCSILGITGGEPLLRKDLEEIIKAASPEMFTILFTSGYKLTPERVKTLKKAGIECVTLGLEYSNPEKQDEIRGLKGSFKYVENAIKICNESEIFTSIATIGTKEKIRNGELERILQLSKKWNVNEIRLISPVATGNWAGHIDQMLGPQEFKHLREFHIKQNKTHTTPIITWISFFESPEFFGCLTGYKYVFIDASGEVCPCDQTPLSFGNVTKEPLKEIWKRMGKSFPRPRLNCLMNEISLKIDNKILPLPPNKSEEIIPKINDTIPLPEIPKRLIKKHK